ncbi:MAG: winged helix-turn-helix domain-containing protein, partial [archaeon]|nr:winged helix-turn-helix domain-containing protein [archaeon]
MSELEYNDHFVICLTPRNGTQIICNPDSLRVFFSLVYEEMSVVDIAAKLEIPKTTAQNRINRLFKDGILDSRPSDMDARRILYRVCAIPLFIDNNYRPWTCPPSDCISNNKLDDERQYYEYFMSVFAKHVFESGINTWPLFLEAGSALSPPQYENDYLKVLDNEERLLKGLRLQGLPDLTYDITYRAEIVIDIHPKRTMKKDHTLMFGAVSGNLIT